MSASLIQEFVARCQSKTPKIGVVGDTIIDEYFNVISERISPEGPIPILRLEKEEPDYVRPGGAANVCYQLAKVGCAEPYFLSLFGDYERNLLENHGIETSRCSSENQNKLKIPVKKRYYNGDHPFCRIDVEQERFGLSSRDLREFQWHAFHDGEFVDYDMTVISDYGKGMFIGEDENEHFGLRSQWIHRGGKTIVDPRDAPISGWSRCTVFKPNAEEAKRLSDGRETWLTQTDYFRERLKCGSVVITDGRNGVRGWCGDSGKYFEFLNPKKTPVRSVIGAGDCFSAFLALAMAHGFVVREAAEIAYQAGAVYVQNVRNQPITLHDLAKHDDPIAAKYLPPSLGRLPAIGRTVMVNGCLDLLHIGHLETLRFAKSKAGEDGRLIVALNSDESVRRLKGDSRPIRPLAERMAAIAALECVDFVTSFESDTPDECIKGIMPDIRVVGSEYKGRINHSDSSEMFFAPMIEGVSTTSIIKSVRDF